KRADVETNSIRCPDPAAAKKMVSLIDKTRAAGDSLGGVIECVIRDPPAGLGEPVFDKLDADLAKAMLSLPATKGFEIGSGFAARCSNGRGNGGSGLVRSCAATTSNFLPPMNQEFEQAAGSPVWQLVFVSIAVLLVLYEILRGWRRGGARQLTRLGALVAAY